MMSKASEKRAAGLLVLSQGLLAKSTSAEQRVVSNGAVTGAATKKQDESSSSNCSSELLTPQYVGSSRHGSDDETGRECSSSHHLPFCCRELCSRHVTTSMSAWLDSNALNQYRLDVHIES